MELESPQLLLLVAVVVEQKMIQHLLQEMAQQVVLVAVALAAVIQVVQAHLELQVKVTLEETVMVNKLLLMLEAVVEVLEQ